MRHIVRRRVLGVTLALLVSACASGGGTQTTAATTAPTTAPTAQEGPAITVSSFAFTESEILAEVYAQALEAQGYPIERNLNLGSREVVQPALASGDIDFVPEYLGSLAVFLEAEASGDPQATWEAAQGALGEGVTLLQYAPAQDQNGFVVTQETADEFGLSAVSDLQPVADQLVLGGPPECPEREFCLIGLMEVYGIEQFADFRPLEIGLIMVEALTAGEIDVALLFTTDAFIAANDLVLLEDDKGLQQAENIAPAVTAEIVDAYGEEFTSFVDSISEMITTEGLTALNAQVQIDQEDAADVARGWLVENGFLE